MNRRAAVSLVVGAAIAALFAWIAMNTYWAEEEVEGMRTGEALYNPYYAAALLARQLGADARVEDAFYPLPPARGVLMLTRWNWDLYVSRRDAIRRWVESGGRLVIDRSLGNSAGFTAWSGIRGQQTTRERDLSAADRIGGGRCLLLQLKSGAVPSDPSGNMWRLCEVPRNFQWFSSRPVQLALGVSDGYQLLRVGVGKGSVTAINGDTTFTTGSCHTARRHWPSWARSCWRISINPPAPSGPPRTIDALRSSRPATRGFQTTSASSCP